MTSLKPIFFAAAMALAGGQLHAAAFTNGSFESGTTGDEINTVPDGWAGKVEYFSNANIYGLTAFEGQRLVDLAWYTGQPVVGGNLSQTFNTVATQTYTVKFSIGGSNLVGRNAPTNVIVGSIGDYIGGSFGIASNPNLAINWAQQSFTFTANGTSSTLSFSNTADPLASFAFLDAVSVTAVPEASGVTMAFAALALLGGIAAKRRRG